MSARSFSLIQTIYRNTCEIFLLLKYGEMQQMMPLTLEIECRDPTQAFLLQVVGDLGNPLPLTWAVTVWNQKCEVNAVFMYFTVRHEFAHSFGFLKQTNFFLVTKQI